MPGSLPPLQLVGDPVVQQNFDRIQLAWDPGAATATALPTGVADGQVIRLQTAGMAALSPKLEWTLRYSTAAGGWVPLSAPPLFAEVNPYTTVSAPDVGHTNTAYAALTGSAGPVVTLPAPGWYDIATGFGNYHTVAGVITAMSYTIDATAAVDADAAATQPAVAVTDTPRAFRQRRKQFAAASTLTAQYKTGSGTATFRGPRTMMATPVLL